MEVVYKQAVEPIIKKAGEILLSHFNKPLQSRQKSRYNLVSDADLESEQFLKEQLAIVEPRASFFAEESGKDGDADTNDYCWVIDPLDGTTNFVFGVPYFCISVALTYKQVPLAGFIYNPLGGDFFYAEKGKGAFLNGRQLRVAAENQLDFLLISFAYIEPQKYLAILTRLAECITTTSYAVRQLGAAALDLAHVAAGRIDGFVFQELSWWDFAAGSLIVHEAGGIVTDFLERPLNSASRSCIAGSRAGYALLQGVVKEMAQV